MPPTRSRRGLIALAGATAVVILAVVLTLVALSNKKNPSAPAAHGAPKRPAHTVVKIDPASGKIVATIAVGHPIPITAVDTGSAPPLFPRGIAVGEGSVWVTNGDDNSVSRIDPVSRKVTTVHTPGTPDGVIVGQGAVWVTTVLDRTLRIDPSTNRVADTISSGFTPVGVDVDPSTGAVWVVTRGCFTCPGTATGPAVERIDPSNDQPSPLRIAPDFAGFAIAVGRGSVWVSVGNGVLQIDPATEKVVRRIQVGGQLGSIAVDDQTGSVWVTTASSGELAGSLVKIDAASGRITLTLPVSCCPGALAVGDGAVWVTDMNGHRVDEVSTTTNTVVATIQVPGAATGVVVGEGGVWVTVDMGYKQQP